VYICTTDIGQVIAATAQVFNVNLHVHSAEFDGYKKVIESVTHDLDLATDQPPRPNAHTSDIHLVYYNNVHYTVADRVRSVAGGKEQAIQHLRDLATEQATRAEIAKALGENSGLIDQILQDLERAHKVQLDQHGTVHLLI